MEEEIGIRLYYTSTIMAIDLSNDSIVLAIKYNDGPNNTIVKNSIKKIIAYGKKI